jgi:hypothetical protein
MATLPTPQAQEMRVRQLQRDGYIECVNGAWLLTDKGWRTLSAAAEPNPPPVKQSKTEIDSELRGDKMLRQWGWRYLHG